MKANLKVLEDFGRDAFLKRKWLRMWDRLGARVLTLPQWMQDIVLEDVNTAIRNRVSTMEMINNANRNHRS